MRKNRKCICCSTEYFYCPNCNGSDRLKPSWYSEFCSEDCKDLWMIATKFNMGMIEKKDAKEMILALRLKDKSEYVACVQRDLENLMVEEPKLKRGKRAEAKILDEVMDIEPTVIESVLESHEVVKKENE